MICSWAHIQPLTILKYIFNKTTFRNNQKGKIMKKIVSFVVIMSLFLCMGA